MRIFCEVCVHALRRAPVQGALPGAAQGDALPQVQHVMFPQVQQVLVIAEACLLYCHHCFQQHMQMYTLRDAETNRGERRLTIQAQHKETRCLKFSM